MTKPDRYVSLIQASAIANVSRRTLYNWINRGMVVYRRTVGGSVRILESSLWADDAQTVRRWPPGRSR